MITLFQVTGALIYVSPEGQPIGYDDVFTRLDKTRAHFDSVGVDPDYLSNLIR
jgi:2,4'-dihydroxyacetophenone dioxygenase